MPRSRRQRWALSLVVLYSALLVVSTVVRHRPRPQLPDATTKRVGIGASQKVSIAYQEVRPDEPRGRLPVLLIHGSPGRGSDFERVVPLFSATRHVIAPDLPGFGRSTRSVPDYSIQAHAGYTLQFMDAMGINRAHVVGFSMGGGVALNLTELAPERIASVTMLSAIGVQELELFGDYHLNHLLHGLQLGALWWLRESTPHFGYLDDSMLGVEYGRNFYDTDQRPMRDLLHRFHGPMLILHGSNDFLVPVEAALEHHRIVPQSELVITEQDHFMVYLNPSVLAPALIQFFERVEAGKATIRQTANPARLVEAAKPFDPKSVPKAVGVAAMVIFLLLATATLISEDLTCISGGLMVAQGRAGFMLVTSACVFGIFVGDLLLFATGRVLGRPALSRAPLKWFVGREAVDRSSAWFARRGAAVILISRFVPGMRLPTYFVAGVLNTSFWRFSVYFFAACLVWTPLLVAASMLFGRELAEWLLVDGGYFLVRLAIAAGIMFVLVKLTTRIATRRGRRRLLGMWRRLRHWEFWPRWAFYPPVILYVCALGWRYRSLTLFTLANPAIPGGGFIGESKREILGDLVKATDRVAQYTLILRSHTDDDRLEGAKRFIVDEGLSFPVVVKPDVGQRGDGVVIVKSKEQLEECLRKASGDLILQRFVDGEEYGVFYYRYPEEEHGHIFAITEKRFPTLPGDGNRTLEELILDDERLVAMAGFFMRQEAGRLEWVPGAGERVRLVELGTHSRGAIFLDGTHLKTPQLEAAIDEISRYYPGFYFGRYDIRTDSVDDLRAGKNLTVIELNGVTSEATSIYDPKNGIWEAYQVLFRQWRIAFEIGAQNREQGMKPTTLRELWRFAQSYQRNRSQ